MVDISLEENSPSPARKLMLKEYIGGLMRHTKNGIHCGSLVNIEKYRYS